MEETDKTLNDSIKERGWQSKQDADETNTESKGDTDTRALQLEGAAIGEEEPDTGLQGLNAIQEIKPVSNAYVGKRNFIHQLMDVALMMANVSQLKALLAADGNDYFYLLITFICLSITLQVVFTICMLIIWSVEKKLEEDSKAALPKGPCSKIAKKERLANWLDRVGSIIVLFIIVSNVFIAGFGVESHNKITSTHQSPQYRFSNNTRIGDNTRR